MPEQIMMSLEYAAIGLVAAFVFFGVIYFMASRFMYIGRPNEVLIFSGRRHRERLADGTVVDVSYRKVFGGRSWRTPILESVERMDLTIIPVRVAVQNAYSNGGIPLTVQAIANMKVSSNPKIVGNAIERFLGRTRAEIAQVARETLEGHLRQVLAEMTPEEVNEERLVFAKKLEQEADDDLTKLGLQLDNLKIQHITDETGYLDSIGRKEIASILKQAEIAESDAEREAAQIEAENAGEAEIARQEADKAILTAQNEMRRIVADLEAHAHSEEERTTAAAQAARATAEQELQKVRGELEQRRLDVDVVVPADAEKRAKEILAKGKAAYVVEEGRAAAAVLDMMHSVWAEAGHRAKEIYLLQHLDTIVGSVVGAVKQLEIGDVNLLDSGDGSTLPAYVSAYPAIVAAVLKEVQSTTGVNVTEVLAGTQGAAAKSGLSR